MNYRTLTTAELVSVAESDPRYRTDALFTQLVDRLREVEPFHIPVIDVPQRLGTWLEVPRVR